MIRKSTRVIFATVLVCILDTIAFAAGGGSGIKGTDHDYSDDV